MNKTKIKSFLKKQIKLSCYTEMKALKPGNVHKYSAGHGMTTKDFYKSADIIANHLTCDNSHFGKKILKCVEEIKKKVKQNTNLGIILLFAPIVSTIIKYGFLEKNNLRNKIFLLIKNQNIKKSIPIFKAIKKAAPGGLGKTKNYDVNHLPKVNLYNAMNYSSKKDLIAKQYVNGFNDVFKFGLPAYKKFKDIWYLDEWALTGVYLTFLKKFNDSHIKRKKGRKIANNVRIDAKKYYKIMINQKKVNSLGAITKKLLVFDKKLKLNGINPGTTADLTVATFFVSKLIQNK